MEKEGLERSLTFLKENDVQVHTLVTDRHLQIRKHMREEWPLVNHRLDGWHVGKGWFKNSNMQDYVHVVQCT